MKKILYFILLFICIVPFSRNVHAEDSLLPVSVYVFSREDCRHCMEEKAFLEKTFSENVSVRIQFLDINADSYGEQWRRIAQLNGLPLATPITVVGNSVIAGFDTADTTGATLVQNIEKSRGQKNLSPEDMIAQGVSGTTQSFSGASCSDETGICSTPVRAPLIVHIPFLGATDLSAYPLPFLSVVLGFVDGFNPCAMWVLVMFLLMLSQAKSRKRMALIAGTFIVAEAILYWLILNVWFTTWNFVAMDRIVTPLVGILALGGGMFFLYEWSQANAVCKIVGGSKREQLLRRIRQLATQPVGIAMIFSVIGLAFSVNIIEFACSIGIPQAFTKILEFNQVNFLQEQLYTGIYILFYMLDDLVVFGIAIWSIDKIGLTAKYTVWTNLIGGILMVLLGFLLLFAPELLRFS